LANEPSRGEIFSLAARIFTQNSGVLSELEMNLKSTKGLGIIMAEPCLLRADELI
jgi:hypothetical protein